MSEAWAAHQGGRRGRGGWSLRAGLCALAAATLAFIALPATAAEPQPPAAPTDIENAAFSLSLYERFLREAVRQNGLGQHAVAEQALRDALRVCEDTLGDEAPSCAGPLSLLALEVSNLGRSEEARLLFERAELLVADSAGVFDRPRLMTMRALDRAARGDLAAAAPLAREATVLRRDLMKALARRGTPQARMELRRGIGDLGFGLLTEARIAIEQGRIEEAQQLALLARRALESSSDIPVWWFGAVDESLAEIASRQGQSEEAVRRQKLALAAKAQALGETRPTALSMLNLGRMYQRGNQFADALQAMRPGIAIIRDKLREGQGLDAGRLSSYLVAAYAVAAYEEARTADPARRAQITAEMFEVYQLTRENITAAAIASTVARLSAGRDALADLIRDSQDADRLRDELRLQLGREAALPAGQRRQSRIAFLREGLRLQEERARKLAGQVEAAFPGYASLVASQPVSLAELAPLLGPDEALFAILLGEETSFGFLVAGGTVHPVRIPLGRDTIAARVHDLREAFLAVGGRVKLYDLAAAHALWVDLLGPVAAQMKGVRHLVMVPAGPLLSLPPALLVTRPAAANSDAYDRASWLIRETAISVLPSVRAFASLRTAATPSAAPERLIAFANPDFNGAAGVAGMASFDAHCQLDGPIPPTLIRGLAPLPDTADEATKVAAMLGAGPAAVQLRGAATEARLRALALDRYRVLYFATHGLLPGELRCQQLPGLALTAPLTATPVKEDDGLLDISEIAGLALDADLVVLSACNTGGSDGSSFGGESLSGLARSFFYAGARSLLVSHWQVESIATTAMMTDMFRRLASDRSRAKAEALREAQLALLAQPSTSHPVFWAAFTLVGDGRRPLALP